MDVGGSSLALLRDKVVKQGAFLFRWRSFLPLLLAGLALTTINQSAWLEVEFSAHGERLFNIVSILVAFSGLAVRIATVGFVPGGTSGRNTRAQRADTLNTTGLYSVVRNPLYVGNILTLTGFLLAAKIWWLVVVGLAVAVFYYERIIMAEEAYLIEKFGSAYEQWAARTPALIPNLRHWRKPAMRFCWKTIVRREYHGFFTIVMVMTAFGLLTDIVDKHEQVRTWPQTHPGWAAFFLAGLATYVVVRVIAKKTDWLEVSGR